MARRHEVGEQSLKRYIGWSPHDRTLTGVDNYKLLILSHVRMNLTTSSLSVLVHSRPHPGLTIKTEIDRVSTKTAAMTAYEEYAPTLTPRFTSDTLEVEEVDLPQRELPFFGNGIRIQREIELFVPPRSSILFDLTTRGDIETLDPSRQHRHVHGKEGSSIQTTAGLVSIHDYKGDLRVRHTNALEPAGTVLIIDSEGNFVIETNNADVYVEKTTGTMSIGTQGGDISLKDVKGNVTLDPKGDIDIESFEGTVRIGDTSVTGCIDYWRWDSHRI